MLTIAITIDEDTLARVDALANGRADRNRSRIVREALQRYLAQQERQEEERKEAEILRRHRLRLGKQATALLKAQAR